MSPSEQDHSVGVATGPSRRTEGAATLVSLLAHSALFVTIAWEAQDLPPTAQEVGALRFSGQTFEIESVVDGVAQAQDHRPGAVPLKEPESESNRKGPEPAPDIQVDQETKEAPLRVPSVSQQSPTSSKLQEARAQDDAADAIQAEQTRNARPPAPLARASVGQQEQSGSEDASAGRAYGAEGAPQNRSDLFQAFLRSLPAAAKNDPTWLTLPLDSKGSIRFRLTLNDDSKLEPIEIIDEPHQTPPEHLRRAVLLTRQFLLHGRLAIRGDQAAGKQELRLRVEVSQQAPDPKTPRAEGTRGFGRVGPSAPDQAYFTYYSGRHVALFLERL